MCKMHRVTNSVMVELVALSTVEETDGRGKEAVLVSCSFFMQGSVVPARREEIKECIQGVCGGMMMCTDILTYSMN